jgi:arginase family enzyme
VVLFELLEVAPSGPPPYHRRMEAEVSSESGLAVRVFRGRVADRNPRAMQGAERLGGELSAYLGREPSFIGAPAAPIGADWRVELDAARAGLLALQSVCESALSRGERLLTVMGRCAAALATLPAVARHRPDARVVWFDAHGDVNTPETSPSGYLGGLVISGACGMWPSSLGGDLALSNVILVGARDLDPAERALIESGALAHVPIGADLPARLQKAIAGHAVYVHLDCDVLEPGIVPTEFQVEGGLTLDGLRSAVHALCTRPVLGLEVAEFEATWPDGRAADCRPLVDALGPLLDALSAVA